MGHQTGGSWWQGKKATVLVVWQKRAESLFKSHLHCKFERGLEMMEHTVISLFGHILWETFPLSHPPDPLAEDLIRQSTSNWFTIQVLFSSLSAASSTSITPIEYTSESGVAAGPLFCWTFFQSPGKGGDYYFKRWELFIQAWSDNIFSTDGGWTGGRPGNEHLMS